VAWGAFLVALFCRFLPPSLGCDTRLLFFDLLEGGLFAAPSAFDFFQQEKKCCVVMMCLHSM
jgi:hypothetical protein